MASKAYGSRQGTIMTCKAYDGRQGTYKACKACKVHGSREGTRQVCEGVVDYDHRSHSFFSSANTSICIRVAKHLATFGWLEG
jgi:hypothetical protein